MSHLSIWIPGPLPGMNEIIAARSSFGGKAGSMGKRWNSYSAMKRDWHSIVAICVSRDLPKPWDITEKVFLSFLWREKGQRRDLDNIAAGKKFVIDGLVECGVLKGDGWKHVGGFEDTFEVDKKAPGVLVTIAKHLE